MIISDFRYTLDKALTNTERCILEYVFKSGSQTQANIAEITNLKQQSVSRLLKGLVQKNFLIEAEKVTTGKKGYPCATFRLNPHEIYSLGLCLMSDAVSLCLINFRGEVQGNNYSPIFPMSIEKVILWVENAIVELLTTCNITKGSIVGIGIGISGSYLGEKKGFNTPDYLKEWNSIDIDDLFYKRLGLLAWSDNDGNVAAIGESQNGVGKSINNFAYIHISAGVGGGVILNGDLWRGKYGNAGEFAGGLPPNIYPFPNLELLRQLVSKYDQPITSISELIELFNIDWLAIDLWINMVRDSLSIICSNATAILDLEAIVLGGRIPNKLAEKVIKEIKLFDKRSHSIDRPTAILIPAQTVEDPAALGAAILPIQDVFFS